MAAQEPDARGVEAYLRAVDVPRAIREVSAAARQLSGLRGAYLDGLALALQVMFDLALERLGNGAPVAYERCVEASIGRPPSPSRPEEKRARDGPAQSRRQAGRDERGAAWRGGCLEGRAARAAPRLSSSSGCRCSNSCTRTE